MIALCVLLGVLPLCLGICGDIFNFALAFCYWRDARRLQPQGHISPVVLAPLFFNGFGLTIIFLMLRLSLVCFLALFVGMALIHITGIFLVGRYLRSVTKKNNRTEAASNFSK